MRKRIIGIDECCIGDKVALDIITETGTVIVTEGTVLNEFIIQKLQNLGINKIHIYSDNETTNTINSTFEELSKEYNKNVDAVKNIIGDLVIGKKLDYGTISNVAEDIKLEINNKDNVIKFLSTFKAYDEYTYNHSLNVAFYSMLLGKWLGLSDEVITELTKSAVMHDLGKAKIPEEILNKKGPLSQKEFEIIKKHSQYGYEIAKEDTRVGFEVLKGILMHHENEDGTGYPLRLKGDKINLFAKIISICDVYDALTQERVYKGRMTPFDAFRIIEMDGYTKFDTKILLTFLHNIASYYIGMQVVLNDGRAGEIVYITPKNVAYPIVKVDDEFIDLMNRKDLRIVSLLN
ncbi:MAG: HD-GYP domain-containing protein [Caloramator sp.]|nr:HD-GYP domain-containing protein [Caloramator sp.]